MPVSFPPALVPFLDLLRCPNCRAPGLRPAPGALRCPAGHAFDVARHGYVSLLTGARATSGDDADMVRARDRFLATGGYLPIRRTLARLATAPLPGPRAATPPPPAGTALDVGCGTGYYLAGVLDRLPRGAHGLGLDASVRALRSAARAHARAAAATCDVFRPLPLADRVADVVLNVFAPRNPAEFHRVLRPAGRLVVARPTAVHLAELRARTPGMVMVDPAKERRLHRALDPFFRPVHTERVEYPLPLAPGAALDLLGMTPSARHVPRAVWTGPGPGDVGPGDGARPARLTVTVSVLVTAYRPR
ncbi:methyltransferase domain-containing protein [Streptomyces sp. NPDC050560]|uniref:methyltransferase domain-containing protein n=1 Tax=Streptomyces sp. NPDC050560 TaxID=3365630 RepID=UPI0037B65388